MPSHNTRFKGGIPLTVASNAQTELLDFTTENDKVYHVRATVIARETEGGAASASYSLIGTFHNDGGTLSQIGSTTSDHLAESTSAFTCAFAVSGVDIQVLIEGLTDNPTTWRGWLEVSENGDN